MNPRNVQHGGWQGGRMQQEHFNPMFMDDSLERDAHLPPDGYPMPHDGYPMQPDAYPHHAGHPHHGHGGYDYMDAASFGGHPPVGPDSYPPHHRERMNGDAVEPYDENSMENLLRSLPSRQLESQTAAIEHTLRRQHSRKHSRKKSFHGRGIAQSDDVIGDMIDSAEVEELTEQEEMEEAIRSLPTTLSTRRSYMKRLSAKKKKAPGKVKRLKYSFGMAWKHFKDNLAELKYTLYLWRTPLKKIEGHFGTGVLSYFLFLKWLLFINIPTVLLTLGFIFVPQVLYRWLQQDPKGFVNNTDFTGLELLTGAGWFSDTEMYYGYYTADIINITSHHVYRMEVAYLFTSGGYYLLTLIILGHSILRSYKTFYIQSGGAYSMSLINKILGSWDYGITSPEAIQLKHKSFYVEVKEYLAGKQKATKKKSASDMCKLILLRLFTNFLVLALICGSGYLIYFLSGEQAPYSTGSSTSKPLLLMVLPVVIGSVHLILPIIFSVIEHYERYEQPRYELYIHIFRSTLLRLSTLGVLVYFWYTKVARGDFVECWETFIGQEVYRLVIVELVFTLLGTFFSEFIRKLLSLKFENIQQANFSIGRSTLELIYAQTLCWLGSFYAPLLSIIVVIKLIIVFYVKQTSAMQNCRPSDRPWRAARVHTIFLIFLFLSYLFAIVAVGIGIILVKPSNDCGPYKDKEAMYSIVTTLIDEWKSKYHVLTEILTFVSSPGFISAVLVALGMGVYYVRTIMVGRRETVNQLRQQLALEGKDKTFLLNLLNQVSQSASPAWANDRRPMSRGQTSEPDFQSPGGRVFVRSIAESAVGGR